MILITKKYLYKVGMGIFFSKSRYHKVNTSDDIMNLELMETRIYNLEITVKGLIYKDLHSQCNENVFPEKYGNPLQK
jgi:hypothetical protein